jgi:predicted Rossmann fold flavoprotein
MQTHWDVIVLGAGGAGMFCAARAAARGRSVLTLDHATKLGQKILISGGGRCNFTNTGAGPQNYHSENEHFAKSALSRFLPEHFLALVRKHDIPFYEKKLGQQFCKDSAQSIVDLLVEECNESGARIELGVKIEKIGGCDPEKNEGGRFFVRTDRATFYAQSVVVALGGLSIPKIGATDLGHRIAKQFELTVTELDPALVSLTMDPGFQRRFGALSGVSVDCVASVNGKKFRENVLLTHTGISGPVILQASLHWWPGDSISFDLSPDRSLEPYFLDLKKSNSRKELRTVLAEIYSDRFAEALCAEFAVPAGPLAEKGDQVLRDLARRLHAWELKPVETGGYGKAEVTRGGVSTSELSSKTLEAKKVPGLFFIGEVVDVTGWLGGYNFQWAWASAAAAAEVV